MDRVTDWLDLGGILMVILGVGWWVGDVVAAPAGLCVSAVAAWFFSWVLQGAPIRKGGRR